jgi:hypothetical protein
MTTSWGFVIAMVISALFVLFNIYSTPAPKKPPRSVTSIVQLPRKWTVQHLVDAYTEFQQRHHQQYVFHLWNEEWLEETQRAKIELTSQDRRDVLELLRRMLPAVKDGLYQQYMDSFPDEFDGKFKGMVHELPNREFLRYLTHGEFGNAPVHALINWLQANAKRCKIPWDDRLLKCYREWNKLEAMKPAGGNTPLLRVIVTTVCMGKDVVFQPVEDFGATGVHAPTRDASEFDSMVYE